MVRNSSARHVVLSVVMASGCGSEAAEEPSQHQEPRIHGTATIEGTVVLPADISGEGSSLAQNDKNQPEPPKNCPKRNAQDPRLEDVVLGAGGFAIDAVTHAPSKTHPLTIERCSLDRPTLAATVGDTIEVTNRDNYPFMPALNTAEPDRVILQDESQSFVLKEAGIQTIGCSFTAGCGETHVATFFHSLHTRSDAEGTFTLTEVPASAPVQISAWHPGLAPQIQTVTLSPGETRKLVFKMKPAARPAPAVAQTGTTQPAAVQP